MINKSFFPVGLGMYYDAPIKENDDKSITVGDFNFSLSGITYTVKGNTFQMEIGDTLYITTNGIKKYKSGEYPILDDLFPNNSAHWLVTRVDDDVFNSLEVQ